MIVGLPCLLTANAGVLLAAHALLRRVRTGQASLDLTLFLLFRLAIVSGIVLVAGSARLLTPWGLGALGGLLLAALLGAREHRALPRPGRPDLGMLPGLFLAAVLFRLLLQVWFFAPYAGDALSYHLPKIAEWVRAGGFTLEHGADTRATFPAGFELVEAWWVAFLHHDVLIEMAGIEFFALMLAASHALAVRLGLAGRAAILASLAASCTPGMLLQATSCLNDGPVAALLIATAALVLARAHPALVAVSVALGLGVKPVFGYALPGLAWLAFAVRKEPGTPISRPKVALALAVLAAVVGGWWYGRNAVLYGNPVHPVTSRGFVTPDGAVLQHSGPRWESLRDNSRRMVDRWIYDHQRPSSAWLEMISGWGPLVFACGILALLMAMREDVRWRLVGAAFLVSLASVLLLVRSDPWFMRFVLFFPALPAIAAARLAAQIRPARLILGLCLVLQLAGTMVPGEFPLGRVGAFARQGWRERQYDTPVAVMPADKALGCLAPGGSKSYLLYRPDFSRRVVTLRPGNADELVAAMKREGLRIVYATYRPGVLAEALERKLLQPGVGAFYELK